MARQKGCAGRLRTRISSHAQRIVSPCTLSKAGQNEILPLFMAPYTQVRLFWYTRKKPTATKT